MESSSDHRFLANRVSAVDTSSPHDNGIAQANSFITHFTHHEEVTNKENLFVAASATQSVLETASLPAMAEQNQGSLGPTVNTEYICIESN